MQQCQIQYSGYVPKFRIWDMFPNFSPFVASPSPVRSAWTEVSRDANESSRVSKKYEKSAENISEYENSAENIALQSTLYERSKHEIKMKKTSRTNVFWIETCRNTRKVLKKYRKQKNLRWCCGECSHPGLEKAPPEFERVLTDEEEVDCLQSLIEIEINHQGYSS